MTTLQGHKIVVTGAAQGLGLRSAQLFVDLGAQVFLADINEAALAAVAADLGVGHATTDVTDAAGVEQMFTQAVERLGGLTGVLHSAGLAWVQPALELDIERWQRVMDVNVRGTQLVCCSAAKRMIPLGGGAIVNMASILGSVGFAGASAYVAAKHALLGLTKVAAIEYAAKGIRVNAVGPAFIETPLLSGLPPEAKAGLVAVHPIGRLGTPEEVSALTLFLLSDQASFITGSYHLVDGGYTAQ